jgi:enamine deaminase RidA (YjgF/YER057c/UK114 family)
MNNKLRISALCVGLCLGAVGYAAAPSTRPAVEYFPEKEPGAAYSAAVRVGDVLYLTGQIGTRADGTLPDSVTEQSRLTMENMSAELKSRGSSLDDVFKCTVMLDDISTWADFNKVYVKYFKPNRLPARDAFGVKGLALPGLKVELVCMAYSPPPGAH